MADIDKVIKGLEICTNPQTKQGCLNGECPYESNGCRNQMEWDALKLLKEQDAKERKWLQVIADNQIANAPKDSPMSLDEQLESEYKSGIYDGLQMAFEMLMEGR